MDSSESDSFDSPVEPEKRDLDWYNSDESDTDSDIPDPNDDPEALFQDEGRLPEHLKKAHFQEGYLYLLSLKREKDVSILGMIVEANASCFIYRAF